MTVKKAPKRTAIARTGNRWVPEKGPDTVYVVRYAPDGMVTDKVKVPDEHNGRDAAYRWQRLGGATGTRIAIELVSPDGVVDPVRAWTLKDKAMGLVPIWDLCS